MREESGERNLHLDEKAEVEDGAEHQEGEDPDPRPEAEDEEGDAEDLKKHFFSLSLKVAPPRLPRVRN